MQDKFLDKEQLERLRKKAISGVTVAIALVKQTAVNLCPVLTGNLRSSISHEVIEEQESVIGKVGTGVEYAPYVEFGTKNMSAQPYLRPALNGNKENIKRIFNQ